MKRFVPAVLYVQMAFVTLSAVVGFLASRVLRPDLFRVVPTRANGQPALVVYERAGDGRYEAHGVQVLTLIGARIARITAFNDPGLVPVFGLAHYWTKANSG